jgi:lipocalin
LFLAKYDPDGNLVWAKTTGQSSALFGNALAVDPAGNCFLTGGFAQHAVLGSADFQNNSTNSAYDAFVAKCDAKGAVLWALQCGGTGSDQGTGIALDANGNCYVTGFFEGDVLFGDQDLISFGDRDMFVCQLNSSGTVQWAQNAGASGKTEGAAIAVDGSGHSWVTGYFESVALFDLDVLSTDGFYDLFLAKYDPQGNVLWATNTASSAINGTGVAVDANGNAYVAGSFVGPATFGALTLTNSNNAVSAIFVAKYDSDGNFVLARQAGGSSDCFAFGIATDSLGGCDLTGSISGSATFGAQSLLAGGQEADALVAKVLGCAAGAANVSFTISPASVPGDYTGIVALQVAGITPGTSVRIEKYLDENGDGQIQPQEPLLGSFTVTDGHLPIIGGVTNWAVYFDADGTANGALTVNLDFSQTTEVDRIGGSYLFKLSDPAGVFSPIVQPFTLTANPLPQGVTGTVTDLSTGRPIPSAEVGLWDLDSSELVASVFDDANGRFTVYSQPGNFLVLPLRRGYVGSFTPDLASLAAATVTVQADQFVTNNVTLHPGPAAISGLLKDAATGAPIPGVTVYALSVGQVDLGGFTLPSFSFAFGLGDAGGAFTIPAQDGDWSVGPALQQLARLGYLGQSDPAGVTLTNGMGTNITYALPKSTALIYGQVKTKDGVPLAGVEVAAVDSDLGFQSLGTTDANGNYTIGVVAGNWSVQPSSSILDGLGYETPDSAALPVEDGSATAQGFSLVPVALTISAPALAANGSLQFQVTGGSGRDYQVYISSDLKNWSLLQSFHLSHSPQLYRDESPKPGSRFYRIQR